MSQVEIETVSIEPEEEEVVAVATVRDAPVASSQSAGLQKLMDKALDQGQPIGELVTAFSELVKMDAERALTEALADFQTACPPIPKRGRGDILTNSGTKFGFDYARLEDIQRVIRQPLREHGLGYTFKSKIAGEVLTVICVVRHFQGATVETPFMCPWESGTKMAGAQKVAAAMTMAKRHALVAALGLELGDPDLDGIDPSSSETIDGAQLTDLRELIQTRKINIDKLLEFAGVKSLAEIPAASYGMVCRMVEQKPRRDS